MRNYLSVMWRLAMFPKINALPSPKAELTAADRDREVHRGERRADMRRHVVVSFGRVDENRVPVGHKPGEELFQIPPHVRVGIFLNEQGRRSVAHMQSHQAVFESLF